MKVTDQMHDGVCQVDLEGRFDANTAGEVEEFLEAIIGDGNTRIIMNLENVAFVASAGLRVILVVAKKLRADKGDLLIAGLQPSVRKVFEISGLNNVLKLFDTPDQALGSFQER